MQDIKIIIHNYTFVFDFVNMLELTLSLLLLISPKREKWHDYVLCLYGGFLFGIVPIFIISGNVFVAFIGSLIFSLILMLLQKQLKTKLYIPLEVLLFKILLIVGIMFLGEQYSFNKFNFYLLLMLASLFVFWMINLLYELPTEKQNYIIRLFALLEFSGVILQIYRNDYIAFEKDLYDIKESVSLFLYLLKVDFEIFDYQYLYIICFLALFILYIILGKIYKLLKKLKQL